MSSRSSTSEIFSAAHSSVLRSSRPARPASIRMLARVTSRAKRSGRMAASGRLPLPASGASSSPERRRLGARGHGHPARRQLVGDLRLAGVALDDQRDALAQLGDEVRRAGDPRVVAQPERPGDQLAGIGIARDEQPVVGVGVLSGPDLSVAAEVTFDLPSDALADPHLGRADRFAELPVDAIGVAPWIEVVGPLEVVLGLGGVADLAADPREPEDANRRALVGAADDVELAALVEQLVWVDLARADLVALHRVVVEDDRLAAEDRRLDLRQAQRDVVAARRPGDPERDGVLLGCVERAGPAPRDLLEGEAQRLGVGKLAIEQLQGGAQGGQLLVGERDRRQMEVLGRQRVVLLLDQPVDGLLDRQHDAQGLQLGAVGVETASERVLVHDAVSLDVTPDLRRRHRPPLGHQIRDQRELTDQFLGVLGHRGNSRRARLPTRPSTDLVRRNLRTFGTPPERGVRVSSSSGPRASPSSGRAPRRRRRAARAPPGRRSRRARRDWRRPSPGSPLR